MCGRFLAGEMMDDEPLKKKRPITVGEDLSTLSVHELHERVGALREEIARTEAARSAKGASLSAAEALFGGKRDG